MALIEFEGSLHPVDADLKKNSADQLVWVARADNTSWAYDAVQIVKVLSNPDENEKVDWFEPEN